MDRSAVSASASDLLALRMIVQSLTVRMACVVERASGVPARDVMLEILEECEHLLSAASLSEFPPRDVQKLREDTAEALKVFVGEALPKTANMTQRDHQ